MLRIYLDQCCYNRPFDSVNQVTVYWEIQAVVEIQRRILLGIYELVWSYVLDYENSKNPFMYKRERIASWRKEAILTVNTETAEIVTFAKRLMLKHVKAFDALHLACAVVSKCDYFITTDYRLLNVALDEIKILAPMEFLRQEG